MKVIHLLEIVFSWKSVKIYWAFAVCRKIRYYFVAKLSSQITWPSSQSVSQLVKLEQGQNFNEGNELRNKKLKLLWNDLFMTTTIFGLKIPIFDLFNWFSFVNFQLEFRGQFKLAKMQNTILRKIKLAICLIAILQVQKVIKKRKFRSKELDYLGCDDSKFKCNNIMDVK